MVIGPTKSEQGIKMKTIQPALKCKHTANKNGFTGF